MKALTLIMLFASFSALACPKLAGNYSTCRSQNGIFTVKNLNISQAKSESGPVYSLQMTDENDHQSSMVLIASGKSEVVSDIHGSLVLQTTKCEGDALVSKMEYKERDQFMPILTLSIQKVDSELVMDFSGVGGQHDVVTCYLTL